MHHLRALALASLGAEAVLVLGTLLALLPLIVGVVLPAVWFKDEQRRRDARSVLEQLLDAVWTCRR